MSGEDPVFESAPDDEGRCFRDQFSRARLSELQRAWFSQISPDSDDVARAVTIERVAGHLASVFRGPRSVRLGTLSFSSLRLEDLGLAVACVDDDRRAWRTLVSRYEGELIRCAEPSVGATRSIVAARRLFIDLRRATAHGLGDALDLHQYVGDRPLRLWLLERLELRTEWRERRLEPAPERRASGAAGRLRVALELLRAERADVRRLATTLTAASLTMSQTDSPPAAQLRDESA